MAEQIERYLETAGAQVRWRRVRPALERELRTHLEEQTEAYLAEGMTEDAAEAEAVRQMGDAETVGLALDAVHRPKKQTAILLFAGLAIVLGMYLRTEWIGSSLAFALASGVLACGALFGGYYLDYRRLSRYAWYIYGAVFVLGAICVYQTTFMGPVHLVCSGSRWATRANMPRCCIRRRMRWPCTRCAGKRAASGCRWRRWRRLRSRSYGIDTSEFCPSFCLPCARQLFC